MRNSILLVLLLAAVCLAQKTRIDLKLPKTVPKTFTWSGSILHNGGRPNGISGTGTWNPAGTGNSFSGTGSWQHGVGFRGGLSGSVGVGKRTSISFGLSGGAGGHSAGHLGVKMKFRRRRSAIAAALMA